MTNANMCVCVAALSDDSLDSRASLALYLHPLQHGDDGGHQAEQQVEADEELVDEASARRGVEDEEEHNSNKRQDVVEDRDPKQGWKQTPGGKKH